MRVKAERLGSAGSVGTERCGVSTDSEFWRVLVYDQTELERTNNIRTRFDIYVLFCPNVTNNPSLLMTLKTNF